MTKLEEILALGFTRQEVLAALIGQPTQDAPKADAHYLIGKTCIARCVGAGVHAGVVTAIDGDTVEMAPGSLRLWRWYAVGGKGALHGVASRGLDHSKPDLRAERASGVVRLTSVCELLECSAEAVTMFAPKWP